MSLREVILLIKRKHPLTKLQTLDSIMREAGVEYDRSHPRLGMGRFNGTQQYEAYLVSWYQDRQDFQAERLRAAYKLNGDGSQ